MEINTTADFIQFLYFLHKKDVWAEHRTQVLVNALYAVNTKITDSGDLYDPIVKKDYIKSKIITLNQNYCFSYRVHGYWDTNVKFKDSKTGRCNILYAGYRYFTSEQEAFNYIQNYRTIDRQNFLSTIKRGQDIFKKEIRSMERSLKAKQKKLAEIQHIIAENDRTQ